MSPGVKDVTVHHSHSALTICLVPGCVGVYPWLQLPGALARTSLAVFALFSVGLIKCFVVYPPPQSLTLFSSLFLCLALSLSSGLSVGLGS